MKHEHQFYKTNEVKTYPHRFNFISTAVSRRCYTYRRYVCITCGIQDWRQE